MQAEHSRRPDWKVRAQTVNTPCHMFLLLPVYHHFTLPWTNKKNTENHLHQHLELSHHLTEQPFWCSSIQQLSVEIGFRCLLKGTDLRQEIRNNLQSSTYPLSLIRLAFLAWHSFPWPPRWPSCVRRKSWKIYYQTLISTAFLLFGTFHAQTLTVSALLMRLRHFLHLFEVNDIEKCWQMIPALLPYRQ